MSFLSKLWRKKLVVCFVDDDPAERGRFEKAMDSKITLVMATSYEECVEKLGASKIEPDLWVLDSYFPQPGTSAP